ncbi:murein biosynthesis integral membrane protein MurJ [bacterium]|jgi:putative peptidoglycan lipid II flippase|nr:murein biosynthesis integral membrane protein MurJ [bacterium]MBT4251286.1 murein biosynthesis integral membrane protein MurJ [bacterium]MBT4598333.1 murein biosynthesis integral membrane protein MurJ [bacterium]MBT6754166.1 murein biosynthesis integral membrane protein MurJ [bacterium]MBT7431806.1 murein biosynthesis integral membrane protein MurJ [bacterium]
MISRLKEKIIYGEKSSKSITRSAMLIATMGIASRILGLFRDRMLAGKFGAGDTLDIYYAAFKIPDLIYGLLVLGALSAAFVPVFTSLISQERKKEAWRLARTMLSFGILLLSVVSVLLFLFAPILVKLIVFGYDAQKQAEIVELTRIMLLSPIILGMSGIIGGILNSFKKFFFYSLAPIFYNVGIIIGVLFLTEPFGVRGLAYGVILGATMHLVVQVPEVVRCGLRFIPLFDYKSKQLYRVLMLMIPRVMGIAMTQINLLVVTILASTLEPGSLAIFNFANNLQSVPLGVFGISFAIASFPALSGLWAQNKKEEFISKFTGTFRKILFFIVPCSAMIYVLRAQIVRVVLGAGVFNWDDTTLTLSALGIFVMSLWAQSTIPLLARTFYAIHNTKTPFFIALFSEVVNVGLALFLIRDFGILGLVAAFSISASVNAALLFVMLHNRIGKFKKGRIATFALKMFIATSAMMIVSQIIKHSISDDPFGSARTFLGVFTQLITTLLGGGITFVVIGRILKIEELSHFIVVLKNKLLSKRPLAENERNEVGGI